MKILFVSAILPYPLYSGGQVRMYNLLKRLSRKHSIHLISFIRDTSEKKLTDNLSFCSKVSTVLRGRAMQPKYIVRSLLSSESFLYATYHNDEMRSLLEAELNSGTYDVLHIEPGYAWNAMPETRVPIVISEHNIEHEVYQKYADHVSFSPFRPFLNRDVQKMRQQELGVWKKANQITAVSQDDAYFISQSGGKNKVTVVSNGVDCTYFAYKPKKSLRQDNPVFLYVGTFAWMQNVDAVLYLLSDIWPQIRKNFNGATLRIVGKQPPKSIQSFVTDEITLIESVPDIRMEYYNADILLAPIRIGGGTKYKILESMACGLPVLTSTHGAQGITTMNGREFWTADSIADYISQSRDIIQSTGRIGILKSARDHVEAEYSWETIASVLESVWIKAYEKNNY